MKIINEAQDRAKKIHPHFFGIAAGMGIVAIAALAFIGFEQYESVSYSRSDLALAQVEGSIEKAPEAPKLPPLDTALYDKLMLQISHVTVTTDPATGAKVTTPAGSKWPVQAEYPVPGAVLPFKRIVAYYGNFYSKQMGVLGEYGESVMLAKLDAEVKKWQAADPTIPVIPGIHYIAVTAQGSAQPDGKYRLRMPDKEIDHAIELGRKIGGLIFLDIQPGLSTPQAEIPLFDKYMAMPDVHIGIDPEFSMTRKGSKKPGTVIGSMDAEDINFVTARLAKIVRENNIPPKIFILHRFTQGMITNYQNIVLRPEVQIVMDMDGWGHQSNKIEAYRSYIESEPVQFAGFKLFYKNDIKGGATMLPPEEVLKLTPQPMYIQYQ